MGWNYKGIEESATKSVTERYKDADKETLLKRIIELETVLSPIYIALSPILDKSWRGTNCTSQLFPLREDDDLTDKKFLVFDTETKKSKQVELKEEELAGTDYYVETSLTIIDGSKIGDEFEILSFHQQAPGAYIGHGSLYMKDVRNLEKAMKV